MNNILEPFEKQYQEFESEICKKKHISIGTLGPQGTSSEYAGIYMINSLKSINNECEFIIELFNDFQYVFESLDNNGIDYALIPTAYERVTDYFWYPGFINILNFICYTPEYGMIAKTELDLGRKTELNIATCPAVQGILDYLGAEITGKYKVNIVTTRSTAEAVKYVLENRADIGITNETSFQLHKDKGIVFISNKYNAYMVWSLFKKRIIS